MQLPLRCALRSILCNILANSYLRIGLANIKPAPAQELLIRARAHLEALARIGTLGASWNVETGIPATGIPLAGLPPGWLGAFLTASTLVAAVFLPIDAASAAETRAVSRSRTTQAVPAKPQTACTWQVVETANFRILSYDRAAGRRLGRPGMRTAARRVVCQVGSSGSRRRLVAEVRRRPASE